MKRLGVVLALLGVMGLTAIATRGSSPPTPKGVLMASNGVAVTYHGRAVAPGQVVAQLVKGPQGCAEWKDEIAVSAPIGVQAGVDLRVNGRCQVVVGAVSEMRASLAACGPAQYSGDIVQLSSGITMAQVTSFQRYYWNCGNLLVGDTSWAHCYAFAFTYQTSPCQNWFVWYYGTAPSSAETHGQGYVVYAPGFGGTQSGWIWVNFEVVAATWRLYANCGWDRSMGDYFHCGIH